MGEEIPFRMERFGMKKNGIGVVGCLISFVALVVAFLSPQIAQAIDPPPKPIEEKAVDFAVKLKDAAIARVKGEEYVAEPEKKKLSAMLIPAVIGTGMLGVGFGLASMLRGERKAFANTAILLGIGAAVVQWSIVFASVLIFFLLVGLVLEAMGIELPSP